MTFVDGLVEREFVDHLAESLGLAACERPQSGPWSRVGNTIGALTLRLNLLSEKDVDRILEIQEVEGGYFGEIAIRQGLLTPVQVSRLLELQRLHDQLQLAAQLVMSGRLDIPALVSNLATFLSERSAFPPSSDHAMLV
jgi:hypothetical protein